MTLRMVLLGGLVAVAASGCASSTQIEDKARTHAFRGEQAAMRGDYAVAAREKEDADRLHAKAVKRAYREGTTATVQVPASVPPPASGY